VSTIERRSNSIMARLLADRPPRQLPLNEELSRYLADGVVERSGCILLKAMKASARDPVLGPNDDETGYEHFVNHIHVDPQDSSDTSQLDLGLTYADRLAQVLQSSGYEGIFRIILSYNMEDRVCTIGFHRVRKGQSWLDDDLEGYRHEGIMVTDCPGLAPTSG